MGQNVYLFSYRFWAECGRNFYTITPELIHNIRLFIQKFQNGIPICIGAKVMVVSCWGWSSYPTPLCPCGSEAACKWYVKAYERPSMACKRGGRSQNLDFSSVQTDAVNHGRPPGPSTSKAAERRRRRATVVDGVRTHSAASWHAKASVRKLL